jgi:hypothetical protein
VRYPPGTDVYADIEGERFSGVTEPFVPEPFVTEPSVPEPFVTDPLVTEPFVTDPFVTEPSVTEPIVNSCRRDNP